MRLSFGTARADKVGLGLRVDLRAAQNALGDLAGKQVPFAAALAVTTLARGVQEAELDEEQKTFDKATPFTKRAFGKTVATKKNLTATVFIKDKTSDKGGQNAYLAPYVLGGNRSLGGKKVMLVPAGVRTNQYGNLSKGTLARLKEQPNVFIGAVTFRKSGKTIAGVWQRSDIPRGRRRDGSYGNRGDSQSKVHGVRTTLKLLIEFEDTTPVRKHLDFYGRAQAHVAKFAEPVLTDALKRAISTGRK